jgi:hypothetical protein
MEICHTMSLMPMQLSKNIFSKIEWLTRVLRIAQYHHRSRMSVLYLSEIYYYFRNLETILISETFMLEHSKYTKQISIYLNWFTKRSLLTACYCTGRKNKRPKFARSNKDNENKGRWFSGCNKFPKDNHCKFFIWLDEIFMQLQVLAQLGMLRIFSCITFQIRIHIPCCFEKRGWLNLRLFNQIVIIPVSKIFLIINWLISDSLLNSSNRLAI